MLRNSATRRRATRAFVRQRDQSDCGVACLASVINYFGGDVPLEHLRDLSGTSRRGTTLLGLYQAARQVGMEAAAFRGTPADLPKIESPTILHVVKPPQINHYVICYGCTNGEFLISDPADGIETWTQETLSSAWQSGTLLVLNPAESFEKRPRGRRSKLGWVHELVRRDLNVLGLALALGIAIAVFSLSTALFSQKLIDDILPAEDSVRLFAGLALLAILLAAANALTYVRQRFLLIQYRDFNVRVIAHFFGRLIRLPKSFVERRKTGDLIARMNDTTRLQNAVAYIIGDVMIDAILFVACVAFVLYYSTSLGLIALSSIFCFVGLAAFYHQPILRAQRAVMAARAANESNYVDAIDGIDTIKVNNREGRFAAMAVDIFGLYQNLTFRLGRVAVTLTLWCSFVGSLLTIAILAGSAMLVMEGTLALGMLVAIFQTSAMSIPAAMRLALTNLRLQEARVAFDRMYEFTSLPPEYEDEADRGKVQVDTFETLSVTGLSFRFPGRDVLLKDVSFELRRGEITAVLGETGCGKTTVLQILQRLYKPESASITINGSLDWNEVSTSSWRSLLGVVPQHVKLFSATLLENLTMGEGAEKADQIIRFCKDYGFDSYFSRFPQGYDTLLGEDGVGISGGQRQLVALARVIYRRPQLLLLDEATAGMDRRTEAAVLALLQKLKRDLAVVLVTHSIRCAGCADRIYVFEEGRIEASGTPETLRSGDNLYARSLRDIDVAVPHL